MYNIPLSAVGGGWGERRRGKGNCTRQLGWCICITKAINNNNKIAIMFKADNCRDDNEAKLLLGGSLGEKRWIWKECGMMLICTCSHRSLAGLASLVVGGEGWRCNIYWEGNETWTPSGKRGNRVQNKSHLRGIQTLPLGLGKEKGKAVTRRENWCAACKRLQVQSWALQVKVLWREGDVKGRSRRAASTSLGRDNSEILWGRAAAYW